MRIQVNDLDPLPIASGSAPALRMPSSGGCIECLALVEEYPVQAGMALCGGDEADGTVAMFVVVPAHQARHPLPDRRCQVGKGPQGVIGLPHRLERAEAVHPLCAG